MEQNEASDVETDSELDDETLEDAAASVKLGHIKAIWDQFLLIPQHYRPKFVPAARRRDVCHRLNEEALVPLLWGMTGEKATGKTMKKICS
ncbi:hypothetical protein BGZ65_011547 [Modicella reniformis]|uniref:Uncharacterized protein n=1 Tax=Modicella reniformis TaxID=1440133 RepID=A0A9P6SRA7_9FUNG|nr:hypothetical protein BGZ65_011547 [Modicella reniformis]